MSNKFLAAATIKRCHALYVEAFKDFRQFEIRIDMYMFVLYSCFQLLLLNYICIKLPHAELSKHQRHPTTTLQQFSFEALPLFRSLFLSHSHPLCHTFFHFPISHTPVHTFACPHCPCWCFEHHSTNRLPAVDCSWWAKAWWLTATGCVAAIQLFTNLPKLAQPFPASVPLSLSLAEMTTTDHYVNLNFKWIS